MKTKLIAILSLFIGIVLVTYKYTHNVDKTVLQKQVEEVSNNIDQRIEKRKPELKKLSNGFISEKADLNKVSQLKHEIANLNIQIKDLSDALHIQGYPEILNRDYLTKEERDVLYKQSSKLTKLEDRLFNLELELINEETRI